MCFGEINGSYINGNIRKQIRNGFSSQLAQGGDFDTLQLRFEAWAGAEFRGARAGEIVTFLDDAAAQHLSKVQND